MKILSIFGIDSPVIDAIDDPNNPINDPDKGLNTDLINPVQGLINGFIGVIGLIAVVMIIVGAVQMQTSQGDTGKLKKAKDTIMYGVIGLVIAILAFAIVNFVLASLFQ